MFQNSTNVEIIRESEKNVQPFDGDSEFNNEKQ